MRVNGRRGWLVSVLLMLASWTSAADSQASPATTPAEIADSVAALEMITLAEEALPKQAPEASDMVQLGIIIVTATKREACLHFRCRCGPNFRRAFRRSRLLDNKHQTQLCIKRKRLPAHLARLRTPQCRFLPGRRALTLSE
jgi:hypothetical protein